MELPDDANSDPCKGYIPTVNDPDDPEYDPDFTFTFYYDREMAADYGMAQAYENDTNDPGTGRVTYNLWASGYPFPNFFYTNLTGEEGATGSAFFTSELIWIGGMPMTRGVPETPGEESCDNDHDANTSGWRYCRSEEHGSFSWRAHEALMAYYSSSAGLASYENNILNEHGIFVDEFQAGAFGNEKDLNSYIALSDGFITNAEGLDNWANTYLQADIKRGDYIVIDPPATTHPGSAFHGFLIIGWGPIPETNGDTCNDLMNNTYVPTDFSDTKEAMTIPYVVDFSGGVSDRTQRPVPRPFYCSKFTGDTGRTFGAGVHIWRFYTLPGFVTLNVPQLFLEIDQ